MERALAHVEIVNKVESCPNADKLDLIHILGWQCVAAKGEFKEGDKCVYFEIDSRVDFSRPGLEFMEKRDGKVKTIKLRGNLSQGLAVGFDKLQLDADKYKVGQDVTKELGVTKILTQEEKRLNIEGGDPRLARIKQRYSKFLKSRIGKLIMRHSLTRKIILKLFGGPSRKAWPAFITKTDETRIENIPAELNNKKELIATEKLDGTSSTFAIEKQFGHKYKFIVCSRNVRQLDYKQECYHDHNVYWDMAFKYKIEKALNYIAKQYNYPDTIILQGETVGRIQGNPYQLDEEQFFAFNLIINGTKLNPLVGRKVVNSININWVPILDEHFICPDTMEEMKELADGYSVLNPKVRREGIVYRSYDALRSFKNVSNQYLLKLKDE